MDWIVWLILLILLGMLVSAGSSSSGNSGSASEERPRVLLGQLPGAPPANDLLDGPMAHRTCRRLGRRSSLLAGRA